MAKANREFKDEIKRSGVCMWQIADELGIRADRLSVKFRYELSEEDKERIREAINNIKEESNE